jgi:hypothetical protein
MEFGKFFFRPKVERGVIIVYEYNAINRTGCTGEAALGRVSNKRWE